MDKKYVSNSVDYWVRLDCYIKRCKKRVKEIKRCDSHIHKVGKKKVVEVQKLWYLSHNLEFDSHKRQTLTKLSWRRGGVRSVWVAVGCG
jgi:hypothetical protein